MFPLLRLLPAAFSVLSLLAVASSARADATAQRLALHVNLLGYNAADFGNDDSRGLTRELFLGVASTDTEGALPGYFGLSYGRLLTEKVLLGVEGSFGYARRAGRTDARVETNPETGVAEVVEVETPTVVHTALMLRPLAELMLVRRPRLLVGVVAALDVRLARASGAPTVNRTWGLGPAGGVDVHYFLLDTVSVDVVGRLASTYLKTKYKVTDGSASYHQFSAAVLVGLSVWFGRSHERPRSSPSSPS